MNLLSLASNELNGEITKFSLVTGSPKTKTFRIWLLSLVTTSKPSSSSANNVVLAASSSLISISKAPSESVVAV